MAAPRRRRQAAFAWDAGAPCEFGTARHPLLLGVVTLAEAVNLMAMCLSWPGDAFDPAGAVMYEAAIGHHGADRVLVHKLAR